MPGKGGDLPVLFWVTDPHPAREEQIQGFYDWLDKNNYPQMELRLDAANREITKKLIQGVSGVAGEIINCNRAKRDLLVFHGVGMLEDVTEVAQELGFSPEHTYPAMKEAITVNGHQYGFPINVSTFQFWVNRETFRKLGLPAPPAAWTWDEFEEHGRAFVERANAAGTNQPQAFFALPDNTDPMALPLVLLRSTGMSIFNETMTASVLDDPRTVEVLNTMHRWTFEERLFPSSADRASFTTASGGFGGAALQLFREGQTGMVMMGRYALLQFRLFKEPLDLAVSELPANGFRNTIVMGGVSAIYAAAENKDLAAFFLAYLASEEHNMQIVRNADGLPPNPAFTESAEFLNPPDYPNEWGVHEAFARAASDIGIPYDYNEFILPTTVARILERYFDSFMNDLIDAETAARLMQRDINAEIERVVSERPLLAASYSELVKAQEQIEQFKLAGKPVPAALIRNPYHLAVLERSRLKDPR